MAVYKELSAIVTEGDFQAGRGWGGSGAGNVPALRYTANETRAVDTPGLRPFDLHCTAIPAYLLHTPMPPQVLTGEA